MLLLCLVPCSMNPGHVGVSVCVCVLHACVVCCCVCVCVSVQKAKQGLCCGVARLVIHAPQVHSLAGVISVSVCVYRVSSVSLAVLSVCMLCCMDWSFCILHTATQAKHLTASL
jgi:hypothetical protein